MGASSRGFIVPVVALLLSAASLRAQDSGPVEPLPSESTPADGELWHPVRCAPTAWFEADWLWTSRAGMWSDTRSFIDGPDAASFDNMPVFTGDNGYRLAGGVHLGNWIFAAGYWHFGDWTSTFNENVNGVAFNANAAGNNWAHENSINPSTYFSPIYNAASITAPASMNTAADQSGLGPSLAFLTDPHPALMAYTHSDFYMTEANVEGAEYLFPFFGHGFRLGFGYVNANLNNEAWVALSGTFRASNATPPTLSLPNSVLTAPNGGNLALFSGAADGFTDGTSNGGTGTPSQLFFTHSANTRNELNGAQVLLDGDLLQYNRLDLGAILKAGVFDNFAQGAITETYSTSNNNPATYGRLFSGSCHQLAFLGGVGVTAAYHVTDEVTLCAGYDVLFLTNLALGEEQINGVSNGWYRVQTDGSAVLQAVHAGLAISY